MRSNKGVKMKKVNIISKLIIVATFVSVATVGLSLATLPNGQPIGFADDHGYSVSPVDEFGSLIYFNREEYYPGYPDPGYPSPIDYIGYPIDWYGYPDPGYPIAPIPGEKPSGYVTNPNEMEPIKPQFVNGRNLWQEIIFQFAKLLEKMK
jgi:hypothetical protein